MVTPVKYNSSNSLLSIYNYGNTFEFYLIRVFRLGTRELMNNIIVPLQYGNSIEIHNLLLFSIFTFKAFVKSKTAKLKTDFNDLNV